MTRKRNEKPKTIQTLESSVTEILITNNGSLKPYIQTFHYEPENIAMQSLGSIIGIFEIEDRSEDSAYIVNFLASIVKKEYFLRPKRSVIESLESTLHKINLALSELIKHDNTQWLGKLNAAICVLEKNNLHFSVSGQSKTLLIRNGVLTDISEGLSEESDLHPLKTFTDVSSGRLKSDDKIIITTPDIFEIFPSSEIQKNAQRFEKEKFSQFIKTALINHLAFGSTLIIDIFEAEPLVAPVKKTPTITSETGAIPNAFSQQAFAKKKSSLQTRVPQETITSSSSQHIPAPKPQEANYTDSKTGHIYVQGEIPQILEERPFSDKLQTAKEWLLDEVYLFQKFIRSTSRNIARSSQQKYANFKKNRQKAYADRIDRVSEQIDSRQQASFQKNTAYQQMTPSSADSYPKKETLAVKTESISIKISRAVQQAHSIAASKIASSSFSISGLKQWRFWDILKKTLVAIADIVKSLFAKMPAFGSNLRKHYSKLDAKQKKYALLIIFLIFVVPFFLSKIGTDTPKVAPVTNETVAPQAKIQPLSQDKNIRNITTAQSILKNNTLVETLLLQNIPFAVTKDSVITLENPEKPISYAIPSEYGSIIRATSMKDLNTLFLLTDAGKLISFTPANQHFSENSISLENPSRIQDIATYLTYLYVLDGQNKTIYRYPRIEGGFGEKTTWLRENTEISDKSSIAISENLYISQSNGISVFNKGKKESIAFENSQTPIVYSQIFTQSDMQSVFILDIPNKRIIQFDKSGAITNQYANDKIGSAKVFSVDEMKGAAYIVTDSELFSLSLK